MQNPQEGFPTVSPGTIKEGNLDLSICPKISRKNHEILTQNRLPEKGDLVFARNASIGIAAFVNTNVKFSIGQNTVLIKPNTIDGRFLYYAINSHQTRRFIKRMEQGSTYKMISMGTIRKLNILVPPHEKQLKIVSILQNVDSLIQTTQRLIDKLTELKKGLMQKLFTEGIGHTEYKDTKLGKIPNEWNIHSLKEVLKKIKNGTTAKQNSKKIGFPVTRIETISFGEINSEKFGYVESLTDEDKQKNLLREGDILFSHINSKKHIGKTAIYANQNRAIYHGMNLLLLSPNKSKIIPKFLHYQLIYLRRKNVFANMSNQAVNQASINQTDLGKIKVFVPSISEQKKIVKQLNSLVSLQNNEKNYCIKLKSIKKGLMQVLLTGKKRVKID